MKLVTATALLCATMAFSGIPRPEHPRPQFERADWINLNGDAWTYTFDFGQSGSDAGRELFRSKGFAQRITVPFCPESSLSGVGHKDFIPAMWYHRKLDLPAAWEGKKILLHFGAVDYESEIYLNGKSIAFHFGGTSSFTVDLTAYAQAGKSYDLVVRVKDQTRGESHQPRGKQSSHFKSAGCHYTRTTGIWQTVWLEAVHPAGIKQCQIVPDVDNSRFIFTPTFWSDSHPAATFRATLKGEDGQVAARAQAKALSGVPAIADLKNPRLWQPGKPYLYEVLFELVAPDGKVLDTVKSYAGLRKVSIVDGRICINNEPCFLRLVLDQGFYPDGIWTAPSDAALRRDIELSMAAGFNGARLHQKVFEERFHYWADKLGYLTWGESSSWGLNVNDPLSARNFLPEWAEIVARDRNHPSIIAWTPFNETWDVRDLIQHQRIQNDAYLLTKMIDPTRPVNTASGDLMSMTDIWAIHNYSRAPKLKEIDVPEDKVWCMHAHWQDVVYHRYQGQPYVLDEFGGLGWIGPERKKAADNTWGYGAGIKSEEEFFKILKDEVDLLLGMKRLAGFCYTQLTDVEQEQNGVYYYDRVPKFAPEKFKTIFAAPRTVEDN
ncbi:MAG: glycoside hydrolase family 2 protein [Kiritimatiellia bacterium]